MVDASCPQCGTQRDDVLIDRNRPEYPLCAECGEPMVRRHSRVYVHGDDIPGGVDIYHGLGNKDGSPVRYYTKSSMAAEAKRRNLVNWVEHIPERGSDKNPNTQRFV